MHANTGYLDTSSGICRFGPVMILLDDIHHFDTTSWQLLVVLCADVLDGCMVLTAMRDHDGVLDAERYQAEDKLHIHKKVMDSLEALLDLPSIQNLTIEGFDQTEVHDMMHMMMPAAQIHVSNVEAILRQTNGHPVHVEQIIFYIESLGGGVLEALSKPGGLLSSNLAQLAATSMTHIILSRVDWLRPAQQLTLKVCSVLGASVTLDMLVRTYPLVAGGDSELSQQLLDDMSTLCNENFLEDSAGQSGVWLWHSTVARDVVYGVIPFKQRRLLHARLASALEMIDVTDVDIVPRSHIAYHWTKSCQSVETVDWQHTMKAITSWQQAAADMDAKGAYLDAVRFMTKSLGLSRCLLTGRQDERASTVPYPEPSTLDIAIQYKFIGDMYFKLVLTDQVCKFFPHGRLVVKPPRRRMTFSCCAQAGLVHANVKGS
jgi:predicted ATPase